MVTAVAELHTRVTSSSDSLIVTAPVPVVLALGVDSAAVAAAACCFCCWCCCCWFCWMNGAIVPSIDSSSVSKPSLMPDRGIDRTVDNGAGSVPPPPPPAAVALALAVTFAMVSLLPPEGEEAGAASPLDICSIPSASNTDTGGFAFPHCEGRGAAPPSPPFAAAAGTAGGGRPVTGAPPAADGDADATEEGDCCCCCWVACGRRGEW